MTEKNSTDNTNNKAEVPSDLNITPADVSNVLQENEYFKLLCINKAQARVIETLENACNSLKSGIERINKETSKK